MMSERPTIVKQLRLVVEADDYDDAVRFYRDVLGLPEQIAFTGSGDARVAILEAGRATLELANPSQRRMIDRVEGAGSGSPRIRIAFEVEDSATLTTRLAAAGADVVANAVKTPWHSLNSRLNAPAGLQITLFQELLDIEDRGELPGFGHNDSATVEPTTEGA